MRPEAEQERQSRESGLAQARKRELDPQRQRDKERLNEGRGAEMEQIRGLRARAPENLGQRKQRRGQRCGKLRD